MIAVYVVTLNDDVTVQAREAVDAYCVRRRTMCQRSGRISRHPQGQTRWSGVVEIDLIHPKLARMCSPSKASLLAEMGVDVSAIRPDQRVVVVHEHALYDHRGHPTAAILMRDLRAAWPGPRRLHAAKLYETGTVSQNVARLADYTTKFRFQYCAAWDGKKTTFLSAYESSWRMYIQRIYQTIGIRRLLNASIKTQSDDTKGPRRMYVEKENSLGEIAEIDELQLNMECLLNKVNNNHLNKHYSNTQSLRNNGEDMRAREIIDDYIDPEIIDQEVLQQIEDTLERQGPMMDPAMLHVMYGDHEGDLDLEQQRLDALKTRAEIARLCAAAARDRAATYKLRAGNLP